MAVIAKCPHCGRFKVIRGHVFPSKITALCTIPQLGCFTIRSNILRCYLFTPIRTSIEIKNPIKPTLQGLQLFHSALSFITEKSGTLKLAQMTDKYATFTTFMAHLANPPNNHITSPECRVVLRWRTQVGDLEFDYPSLTLIRPLRLGLEQLACIAVRLYPDLQINPRGISFQLLKGVQVRAPVGQEALHILKALYKGLHPNPKENGYGYHR